MAEHKRWAIFDKLFGRKRPTTDHDALDDMFLTGGDPLYHEPLTLELTTTRSLDEIKAEVRAHLDENTKKLSKLRENTTFEKAYHNITAEEWVENRLKLRQELAARKGPRTVKTSAETMAEWKQTEEGKAFRLKMKADSNHLRDIQRD